MQITFSPRWLMIVSRATAVLRHGVDGLDAGLEGGVDRLPAGHPGRHPLDRPGQRRQNRPLAVARVAERVDDPADHAVADRHPKQVARRTHLFPLGNLQVLAEDDDADGVLFEVEGDAADLAVGELDHFAGHDAAQAVDAGDAIADLEHPADLVDVELAAVFLDLLSDH
jgi:hypothetical protein